MDSVPFEMRKNASQYSQYSPLSPNVAVSEPYNNSQSVVSVGQPKSIAPIGRKDVAFLLVVVCCFAFAAVSVYSQRAAIYLGQTNQLIIIGFCLAVMAMVCQKQVPVAYLMFAVQNQNLTLQDIDGMLFSDLLARKINIYCRLVVFLLLATPLALSVAYKRYIGGQSTIEITSTDTVFGLGSPPGFQRIGLGLSMTADVFLPFWTDPHISKPYGFNLLVASNETGAVLDIPLSHEVLALQKNLLEHDLVYLTAVVNATVATEVSISPEARQNETFWKQLARAYQPLDLAGGHFAFFAQDGNNHSISYTSIYRTELRQSLSSEMREIHVTRRQCTGTWAISKSNMTLVKAELLDSHEEARIAYDQSLIEANTMDIDRLLGRFIAEYDPTRYPRDNSISTIAPLVATMVWARLVEQCGSENNELSNRWVPLSQCTKPAASIKMSRSGITLKRSGSLILVLIILPVVSLLTFTVKVIYYRSPIDSGFGLISFMASMSSASHRILEGAALSGDLSRPVSVRFVVQDTHESTSKLIKARLDEVGRSSQLQRNTLYG